MPERPASCSGPTASPFQPASFLCFDFGTRRVGVATGNTLLRSAQPLKTLQAEGDARFAAIAGLISQWQPCALVVGVPFHPDGAAHENTRRAQRFARQLHGRFRLPVHEVDERYTTTEALAAGAADADAAAAALILEQFLRSLDASEPPGSEPSTAMTPLPDPAHAAA
jgi:putative Holliday junction resolvase